MIRQQCKSQLHYLVINGGVLNLFLSLILYIAKFSYSIYSFWILPSLVLKKMVMGNFTTEKVDGEIVEAIDFMVERVWIFLL